MALDTSLPCAVDQERFAGLAYLTTVNCSDYWWRRATHDQSTSDVFSERFKDSLRGVEDERDLYWYVEDPITGEKSFFKIEDKE